MKHKPELLKLIGKKIKAIKGNAYKYDFFGRLLKKTYIEPQYILFDDRETFIELEDQDYSYHDANESAKLIKVKANKEKWNKIMRDKDYTDITDDGDIEIYSFIK